MNAIRSVMRTKEENLPNEKYTGSPVIVRVRLAWVLAAFAAIPLGARAASPSCGTTPLEQVDSVTALSRELQSSLGVGNTGSDGIADRGDQFDATDVRTGLAGRRYAMGAAGKDCAVVAIEVGGRGYRVERWVYRLDGAKWSPQFAGYLSKIPTSLGALLERSVSE